jgi:hypothetical protein
MTNATTAAADAPLLIADDDNWHSIWCAKVRDSEVVKKNADIGGRDYCWACELFVDAEVVGE